MQLALTVAAAVVVAIAASAPMSCRQITLPAIVQRPVPTSSSAALRSVVLRQQLSDGFETQRKYADVLIGRFERREADSRKLKLSARTLHGSNGFDLFPDLLKAAEDAAEQAGTSVRSAKSSALEPSHSPDLELSLRQPGTDERIDPSEPSTHLPLHPHSPPRTRINAAFDTPLVTSAGGTLNQGESFVGSSSRGSLPSSAAPRSKRQAAKSIQATVSSSAYARESNEPLSFTDSQRKYDTIRRAIIRLNAQMKKLVNAQSTFAIAAREELEQKLAHLRSEKPKAHRVLVRARQVHTEEAAAYRQKQALRQIKRRRKNRDAAAAKAHAASTPSTSRTLTDDLASR